MPDIDSDMTPLADAFAIIEREVSSLAGDPETLPTAEALGRVLMGTYISRTDLPPFDKSAMDGYAILLGDDSTELEVLEIVGAGETPANGLVNGSTVKVMTGAPVPAGTERVVPVERCVEIDGRVRILSRGNALNICRRGEDLRIGDSVLNGPTRLGPMEISNLISCGLSEIQVYRRPRVIVLNTGDEIVDTPDALASGKIMNSNGPLLDALCAAHGLDLLQRRIVPDDRTATGTAIREAVNAADLVLLTGGVSVGDFDFVGEALADQGLKTHFSKVAVKPGRPLTFATRPGKAVFGLPGNPVAVFITFQVFVRRALHLLNGLPPEPRTLNLPLATEFRRRKMNRREYVPCHLLADGSLEPIRYHGSADTMALLGADGLFIIDKGCDCIAAGTRSDLLPTKDLRA
ncbi:MAG: molybdopterin molybdotransferase MoeA [bacterium]|nr:molybdopterin molybdotransferase MoeA [bacterium]